jgi:hypothetical protein
MRTLVGIKRDIVHKKYQKLLGRVTSEIYEGLRDGKSQIYIENFYNNEFNVVNMVLRDLDEANYIFVKSEWEHKALCINLVEMRTK